MRSHKAALPSFRSVTLLWKGSHYKLMVHTHLLNCMLMSSKWARPYLFGVAYHIVKVFMSLKENSHFSYLYFGDKCTLCFAQESMVRKIHCVYILRISSYSPLECTISTMCDFGLAFYVRILAFSSLNRTGEKYIVWCGHVSWQWIYMIQWEIINPSLLMLSVYFEQERNSNLFSPSSGTWKTFQLELGKR